MYHYNDIEMWREHHHELLREAEEGRLSRRLRAEQQKKGAPGFRSALLALSAGRLPQRKGMAEC
jgi:hypothetical protein